MGAIVILIVFTLLLLGLIESQLMLPKEEGVSFKKKVISSTLAMHPSSSLERLPAAEDFVRHCNALWNGRVEGTGGVDRGTLQHPLCTSVTSGRMKKATSHPKFIELSSP